MWTQQEALELIRTLDPIAAKCGYHIGLCGSVLHHGASDDDLDLVLFPLKTSKFDWHMFQASLNVCGFSDWEDRTPYHEPEDTKRVLASLWRGKRIDWFLLQ